MRSARVAIVSAALVLVLLPLAAMTVAFGYEQWLMFRFERALESLADEAITSGALEEIGSRGSVELFWLDASGEVRAHSNTRAQAARPSSMAAATQAFRALFGEVATADPWRQLDNDAGALTDRSEVREAMAGRRAFRIRESSSGDAVLFSFAAPHPRGGALYVQTATVRGLRRLGTFRGELLRLSLYQLIAAVAFAALLGRWLVKPLERLSDGAARFPTEPLAAPALLKREDEVGQLARSFDGLAKSLEERRRETVALAADMAHELKNPLATIGAAAELVGNSRDLTPAKRALVQAQITSAVERLQVTCDELLAQVRFEATLPTLPREHVQYPEFLSELIAEYQADPRYAEFRFTVDVAADVRDVMLIPGAWRRLLRNLIDNALIQPTAHRELRLSVHRTDDTIFTTVRDFGPGISAGNRDKVFRRFFTQRPEGSPPGTGLGLSIVRAVAQAHGGDVALIDTDGPGASFRVSFVTT